MLPLPFLVVLVGLAAARVAPTQRPACDAGLLGRARGPHGYAWRVDRCEGIYVQQVGGTVLSFASLIESFEDYALAVGGAPLTIEWTAPGTVGVSLRAQGIKRDLYYRMDAARPPLPPTYRWPSDLLAAQRIPRRDVGVLAWTRVTLGGVARDVYLPVRIGQRNAPARADAYELVLFPTVPLQEVFLTVAEVDSTGRVTRTIHDAKPLRYGFYPADRPVRLRLENLGPAGFYRIGIGATLKSGGSVALVQWIYHAHGSAPH